MMELSFFLQMCLGFFAILGYLRGFYKEFVAFSGLMMGLFVLTEFDWALDLLLSGSEANTRFTLEALLLMGLAFFCYEYAPTTFVPRAYRKGKNVILPSESGWQRGFLGAVVGGFNGYLLVGSLWYLMDQYEYPLSNLFMQPAIGSRSAEFVGNLPLVWLQDNNLLLWIVMGLFLLIAIFR